MGNYLAYMASPVIIYVVLTWIYQKPVSKSEKLRKRYIIICSVILFAMIACMHRSVGSGDAQWYYNNWEYMSQLSWDQFLYIQKYFDIEKGYLYTVWLLSKPFRNPQFIFVFYGLLVAVSVGKFIDKNCENTIVGFVMFNCLGLWGFMVQGLRQGIAMCICLLAIEYCKQRKPVKFLMIVLLATMFHASAVAFVIVYVFSYFEMNPKGYIAAGVGMAVSFVLMEEIFSMVNYLINDTYTTDATERTSGGFVSLAIYILIIAAILFFYRGKKTASIETKLFFYMLCCGFITFAMRYSINTITQRIAYYFMFSQIPMMSQVTLMLKRKDRFLASAIVIGLCLGITVYKAGYSELVPFIFFWQM